ncbi:MAG: DUF2283 domain-containing protein [Desulfurococcales archaeon]|nr:DUF2283 domain-containing protein [Desulfurococcales archaeon]
MVKKVHYDPEADILYIITKEGPFEDTLPAEDDVYIEVDENGNIIGIEIWKASINILENITNTISKKLKKQIQITK